MSIGIKQSINLFTLMYFFALFGGAASLFGGDSGSNVYAIFWAILYFFTLILLVTTSISFRFYKYELPILIFCVYVTYFGKRKIDAECNPVPNNGRSLS